MKSLCIEHICQLVYLDFLCCHFQFGLFFGLETVMDEERLITGEK